MQIPDTNPDPNWPHYAHDETNRLIVVRRLQLTQLLNVEVHIEKSRERSRDDSVRTDQTPPKVHCQP